MNWSPLQREMLEAMGFSPLQFAAATANVETPAEMPVEKAIRNAAASQAPHAGTRDAAPMRERAATADTADAMTAALLRAAGRDPQARERVLALCPSPRELRGDARAKRALWPRLRALRGPAS